MPPKDAAGTIQHAVLSRLKMRQLALLQAIDRHRALNRVANEMRLSQPAITKALREVEDIFGTALFTRSSRGLAPTAAGDAVLLQAKRWLADLESTSHVLAASNAGHGGGVRIGITTQVAQALLTAALKALLGQSPRLSAFIIEGTTDQLVGRMVSKGATKTSGRNASNSAVSGATRAPSPFVNLLSSTRFRCSTHPTSPSLDRNSSGFGCPSVTPSSATRRLTSCPFATASQAPSHVAADALSSDRRFVTGALRHPFRAHQFARAPQPRVEALR